MARPGQIPGQLELFSAPAAAEPDPEVLAIGAQMLEQHGETFAKLAGNGLTVAAKAVQAWANERTPTRAREHIKRPAPSWLERRK